MYKYCRARRKARRLVILLLHMSSITIISSTCLDSYIADPAVRMFVTRGVYTVVKVKAIVQMSHSTNITKT